MTCTRTIGCEKDVVYCAFIVLHEQELGVARSRPNSHPLLAVVLRRLSHPSLEECRQVVIPIHPLLPPRS